MSTPDPDSPDFVYDEMSMFGDNATDAGFALTAAPSVQRIEKRLLDGRTLSGLRFGDSPRVAFLHGTGQNAHTWDTTVLAMGVDAICIDLAGHGHSSWRDDRRYSLDTLADDVAQALPTFVDRPVLLVGMSLGGMVATEVARRYPELVSKLVTVDITPGVTRDKAKHIHDFIEGPQTFSTFASLFDRTMEFNPTRSASSLRRGILHNASRQPDGSWKWRYDRRGPESAGDGDPPRNSEDGWAAVEALTMEHLLVRGMAEGSVVDDADVAELARRRPASRVVEVDGAGHSVQGDRPVELAAILLDELVAD